jgi:hypothetical protein
VAFSNALFTGITDYALLELGTYDVKVLPAGAAEPVVIKADLELSGIDYTVLALGTSENIEPLVLIDNNSPPEAGKAHVRFVHTSPTYVARCPPCGHRSEGRSGALQQHRFLGRAYVPACGRGDV